MVRNVFSPDDPALPMNYPGFVFRTLCEEGHSPDSVLADTGLEEASLSDPNFRCGFLPLRRLLLNAIAETKDPHLGVRLAMKFQPTYIGLPAYAAMNAAHFQDGLHVLQRFFSLNFPAFEFKLVGTSAGLRPDEAAIRLRANFPFTGIEYFSFSSAIIAVNGLLEAMLKTDKVATRAETTVSAPQGWSEVEAQLAFPFHFSAGENQIVFPRDLLDRPLPGSDPINHARLIGLCEQFDEDRVFETTMVTEVVSVLEGARSMTLSLSEVATELGYSERGLRRQLDRSGTSYRKLLDEVRERRARTLLSGRTHPIKAIAGMLGFESSSNFARSFKRWTGLTPKAFRDQALAQDDPGRK